MIWAVWYRGKSETKFPYFIPQMIFASCYVVITLVCGPTTRQHTSLPVQFISCDVVQWWPQSPIRWCYNALRKQFEFGGVVCLHGALLLHGNAAYHSHHHFPTGHLACSPATIQPWLGRFGFSCVGKLEDISELSNFRVMTLSKLGSRCGFENGMSPSAARAWKISSYAMTSARTSLVTAVKKDMSRLNRVLYMSPVISIHLKKR